MSTIKKKVLVTPCLLDELFVASVHGMEAGTPKAIGQQLLETHTIEFDRNLSTTHPPYISVRNAAKRANGDRGESERVKGRTKDRERRADE